MTPNITTDVLSAGEVNGFHKNVFQIEPLETPTLPLQKGQSSTHGFGTRAIHAGQEPDPHTGAVIPPISLSTTFQQSSIGVHKGFEYSRSGNPTRQAFEEAVAALEKGKYALAFSSGSAVTATIVAALGSGGHIISVNDVYGGTFRYFTKVATNQGIETTFVDLLNPYNIESAFKHNTKIVWVETPTNPTLRLVDIRTIARLTHRHGAILVVDNTFMSPYFQNPLELGADVVVHSVTKYINGHSDVVMGVAITSNEEILEKLRFLQNAMGAVPSAFDCWLANRGLKTLHVRMRQHQENALAVARYLEKSNLVEEVIYPGLESHPQHSLAKKQAKGFGGMVSFRIKGGFEAANTFFQNLKLFTLAESLGGVESLAEHPARMTHASVSEDIRAMLGVTDNLIRLSVGIEETEDLISDIEQALEAAVTLLELAENRFLHPIIHRLSQLPPLISLISKFIINVTINLNCNCHPEKFLSMPLRIPPTQLANHVARLIKGGIYKTPPVWFQVVQTHPPGPSLLRTSGTTKQLSETLFKKEISEKFEAPDTEKPKGLSYRKKHTQKKLRTRPDQPQPIVYPEDRLRRRFYRDHPYELLRPRILMEKEIPADKVWTSLLADGEHASEITGESVIQYQFYLMMHEGLNEQEAYAIACNEFYAIRARQEVEERVAEEQALAFGAVRPNSEVEKAMWKEHKVLRKSRSNLNFL
ncbi:hypothetical protein G9A89_021571 [Geosiphon pyriformis]|nr:hypothetical protein G9A89_021571 [Geosiphon pyriformis]